MTTTTHAMTMTEQKELREITGRVSWLQHRIDSASPDDLADLTDRLRIEETRSNRFKNAVADRLGVCPCARFTFNVNEGEVHVEIEAKL